MKYDDVYLMYLFTIHRSKKEFCRERKEGMLHGQGTPPTLVDSMSHRIYDLLPEKFEPLDNPNDNDETCTETLPVVLPQLDNNEGLCQLYSF